MNIVQIIGVSLLSCTLPLLVSAGLITESSSSARVSGEDFVGGLIGGAIGGAVLHSHASGEVSGDSAIGGLVGLVEGAQISRSHASGNVDAEDWDAGGLVGVMLESGTIADSFATGAVAAYEGSGGLVAYIENSTIVRCYSTGLVSDDWDEAGGLVGWRGDGVTIEASYWNTQTSGESFSDGGEGRTTAEMTYPHAANTYVGWNFEGVWVADTDGSVNNGYPYLGAAAATPEVPTLLKFSREQGAMRVWIDTESGVQYVLEATDDLMQTPQSWTTVHSVWGDNQEHMLEDGDASPPSRFYRIRVSQ